MNSRPLVLLRPGVPGAVEINRRLWREHRAEQRAERRAERRQQRNEVIERRCEICEQTFRPHTPWLGMSNPVPVCYPCSRDVPVRTSVDQSRGGLTHAEAMNYGSLFASIRAAIYHLEKEIERQTLNHQSRALHA